jgi:hypothetical protein
MKRTIIVLILLGVLSFAGAAGSGILGLRTPSSALAVELQDDGPSVTVSPKAALRFVEKVSAASQNAVDTGQSTLTVTQREVTSFLNIWTALSGQFEGLQSLENVEALQALQGTTEAAELQTLLGLMERNEALPGLDPSALTLRLAIKEPEVRFTADGRIVVRGYVAVLFWQWPTRIVVAPRASQGEMVLDFVEGNLGRISMPEVVFDLIGRGLARAILAGQQYAEITQIRVSEGQLTISGRYNK